MTAWIDVIVGLMVIEGGVLLAWRRYRGHGVAAATLVPNLLAGAMLLLAVRFALGGSMALVGLCLLGSLCAHVADLRSRWA